MREILFRAKRKDNGEWIEGNVLQTDDGNCYIATSCLAGAIDEPLMVAAYKVDPETLCQFTGMSDKKGKHIWENDILHRAYHSEDDCVVVWNDGRFCFKTIHGQYNQDPMTLLSICFIQKAVDRLSVIGNVFDDKHLLSGMDYSREQEKETED